MSHELVNTRTIAKGFRLIGIVVVPSVVVFGLVQFNVRLWLSHFKRHRAVLNAATVSTTQHPTSRRCRRSAGKLSQQYIGGACFCIDRNACFCIDRNAGKVVDGRVGCFPAPPQEVLLGLVSIPTRLDCAC